MGTHPIFESDFDCLTDCFKSKKCSPVLLVQLLYKSKRDNLIHYSSGIHSHFWKRSLLDLHWLALVTPSEHLPWANHTQLLMATRQRRRSFKVTVPKSKFPILNLFSTVCPFAYKNEEL